MYRRAASCPPDQQDTPARQLPRSPDLTPLGGAVPSNPSTTLEAARSLPPATQDDIARVVLRLAGTDEAPPAALSPEERAAIATSQAAAARGVFATDVQVRAVWAKHAL